MVEFENKFYVHDGYKEDILMGIVRIREEYRKGIKHDTVCKITNLTLNKPKSIYALVRGFNLKREEEIRKKQSDFSGVLYKNSHEKVNFLQIFLEKTRRYSNVKYKSDKPWIRMDYDLRQELGIKEEEKFDTCIRFKIKEQKKLIDLSKECLNKLGIKKKIDTGMISKIKNDRKLINLFKECLNKFLCEQSFEGKFARNHVNPIIKYSSRSSLRAIVISIPSTIIAVFAIIITCLTMFWL